MEYLQNAGAGRIRELVRHSEVIAREIKGRG